MGHTKLTITISIPLDSLKKAYAKYFGETDWRKVKKSDIAAWAGNLAEADIACDLNDALDEQKEKRSTRRRSKGRWPS